MTFINELRKTRSAETVFNCQPTSFSTLILFLFLSADFHHIKPISGDNFTFLAPKIRSKEANEQACWQLNHVRCGCLATGNSFCFKANREQLAWAPAWLSFFGKIATLSMPYKYINVKMKKVNERNIVYKWMRKIICFLLFKLWQNIKWRKVF